MTLGKKVTPSGTWVIVTVECHINPELFTSILLDWEKEKQIYIFKAAVIWGLSVTQHWIKSSDMIVRSFNKKDAFFFNSLMVRGKPIPYTMSLHLSFIMFICPQSLKVQILKLILIYLKV